MKTFNEKVIWITGASSGTGEALCYAFANENAKIIISARRQKMLERVKAGCPTPENIFILPIDLEKHEELPQAAQKAISRFGRIDILFNNGGISQRSLAKDTNTLVDKRLLDINYLGTIIITKAVLSEMITQKSGHIAVMTSLAGKFGVPYRTAYAASKHALHGFFDSLRAEVHQYGINITLIASGYIRTQIAHNAFDAEGKAQHKPDPGIENGMSPEYFAQKALKAIKTRKQEILLGGKEKYGVYLKRFAPKLLSKIIRKQL